MELHLSFLGEPQIRLDGNNLTGFVSNKSVALLCYLALTKEAQPRTILATLLWGNLPEARAKHNLRVALSDLRKKLGVFLKINRQNVRIKDGVWVDVDHFERAVQQSNLDLLNEAVALYTGEFLEGMEVVNAPSFEEWVLSQRERLRSMALQALHTLSVAYANRDTKLSMKMTGRLLALEPWREEAHRLKMLLLARRGQYNAALKQYKLCESILAEELGVAPMTETTKLFEKIRAARRTPRHNLPGQQTPFIGREKEIREITARLTHDDCRLVTLTGLGGIGKTRLAFQVAETLQKRYLHGVRVLSLSGVSSPDFFVTAIGEGLGFTFRDRESPKKQLLNYLQNREMLLVLDNFEHLLSEVRLLSEILREAPGIKILVTSRDRLNLQSEWVYKVFGLDHEVGNESNATKLFQQAAQRSGRKIDNLESKFAAIARICGYLEGMPLGIELAASWSATLPLETIETQLRENLDFLSTEFSDVPEKHRSIRAIFEATWRMLSPQEKIGLMGLSVFRSSFDLQAAATIVGIATKETTGLTSRSLLRVRGGRFQIHELTRQFASQKLSEEGAKKTAFRRSHCLYFANFLGKRASALGGKDQLETLSEIAEEIENIRTAWAWALENELFEALGEMAESYFLFLRARAWWEEAESAFKDAVQAVKGKEVDGDLLGTLLYWLAFVHFERSKFAEARALTAEASAMGLSLSLQGKLLVIKSLVDYRLGDLEAAETAGNRAMKTADALKSERLTAEANAALGQIANQRGDYEEAIRFHQAAVAYYEKKGDILRTLAARKNIGVAYYGQGNFAQMLSEDTLNLVKKTNAPSQIAITLNGLGAAHYAVGHHEKAVGYFTESLEIAREIGYPTLIAFNLNDLGYMHYLNGHDQAAKRAFEEGLAIYERTGEKWGIARSLNNLGMLLTRLGETEKSKTLLEKSIQMRKGMEDKRGLAYSIKDLGNVYIKTRDLEKAQTLGGKALGIFEEIGNKEGIIHAQKQLGDIARKREAYGAGEEHYRAALAVARDTRADALALEVLHAIGVLINELGKREEAAEIFEVVAHHPKAPRESRLGAKALLPGSEGRDLEDGEAFEVRFRRLVEDYAQKSTAA